MSWAVFSTILAAMLLSGPAYAESPVERGKYLASFSRCDHCHTSGCFFRKPDVSRKFSCSDVGFKVGRSLPPVKNQVPDLFGPHEKPPIYVMQLPARVLTPRPPRNDNSHVREVTDG